MKKKITLLFIAVLLTACGNKITCKKTTNTEAIKMEQIYKITSEKDMIKKLEVKQIYTFKENNAFEKFEEIMEIATRQTNDNIVKNYKKKNKKYILTETYNMENIDDQTLSEFNISKNKKEYINALKSNGMKCK